MFQVDSVLSASFFGSNTGVSSVVEDHAVLQNFYNRSTFVISCCFQHFYGSGTIYCNTTCEETSAGTESQLCRMERVFHCSVRR